MIDPELIRLGKQPARIDPRTIRLMTVFRELPPLPNLFNVDVSLGGIPDNNMYKNDVFGDCVIAGRAHNTLRFESFEQAIIIPITDSEVETEYFLETGGADNGLVLLNSLNFWRRGWIAGGKNYNIFAYAAIDTLDQEEIKASIYLLRGIYTGILLPNSAKNQQVWDVDNGPQGTPGSWGGHCVYIFSYDEEGLTCMTWGEQKKMTWGFFQKYCDEAFGIVDDRDSWVDPATNPIDIAKLQQILSDITGEPIPDPQPPNIQLAIKTASLPTGVIGKTYSAVLEAIGGTPPYSWRIASTVPSWLNLIGNILNGIPFEESHQNIAVQLTDSAGSYVIGMFTLAVTKSSPCKVGNVLASTLNLYSKTFKRKGRFYYLNP